MISKQERYRRNIHTHETMWHLPAYNYVNLMALAINRCHLCSAPQLLDLESQKIEHERKETIVKWLSTASTLEGNEHVFTIHEVDYGLTLFLCQMRITQATQSVWQRCFYPRSGVRYFPSHVYIHGWPGNHVTDLQPDWYSRFWEWDVTRSRNVGSVCQTTYCTFVKMAAGSGLGTRL